MKGMRKIGLFATMLIFCACSARIQSIKASDFSQKVRKFYAVVKIADNTGEFDPKFSAAFQEGLKERGVAVQFAPKYIAGGERELARLVRQSGADALLIVTQTESVAYKDITKVYVNDPKAFRGEFDIRIFLPEKPAPVWNSQLRISTGGYGNIGAIAKPSAEMIIKKLVKDDVI
jgi:hypothetical protein